MVVYEKPLMLFTKINNTGKSLFIANVLIFLPPQMQLSEQQ
jgi:hypothetical protein